MKVKIEKHEYCIENPKQYFLSGAKRINPDMFYYVLYIRKGFGKKRYIRFKKLDNNLTTYQVGEHEIEFTTKFDKASTFSSILDAERIKKYMEAKPNSFYYNK